LERKKWLRDQLLFLELTLKKRERGFMQKVKLLKTKGAKIIKNLITNKGDKMAKYKYLVIHCSATKEGVNIKPEQIVDWHTGKNGRGWSRVGYSDVITLDGSLHNLHYDNTSNPYDDYIEYNEMTWGVKGINKFSKHVCYIGGLDSNGDPKNTMTNEQNYTLEIYLKHELLRHPDIVIAGHNQFSNKACPSFFVPNYCKNIGIDSQNVYMDNPNNYNGF
jgi:N-acetylmuramoyl-L-alanine amidase